MNEFGSSSLTRVLSIHLLQVSLRALDVRSALGLTKSPSKKAAATAVGAMFAKSGNNHDCFALSLYLLTIVRYCESQVMRVFCFLVDRCPEENDRWIAKGFHAISQGWCQDRFAGYMGEDSLGSGQVH